jgi:RHS repeat-associated protein
MLHRFGIDKLNPTVTSDYSYDAYGRLTELKHSAGKIILSDNLYVLDDFDRLIKEVRDGQNRQIGYDSTNQVTSVAGVGNESYSYDQNGNRLNNTTDTGNRLISDGVYDYVYDAEGNRISRKSIASGEVTTYQWDYRNRLTGVQIGSKLIAYSYDSQDRRIAKFVDGALVERYGHDGTNLAVVFDASGAVAHRYLYGGSIDEVLADQTPTSVNWALADRLGTVDLIVDAQGGVIDRVTFDSFGNKVSESAPAKAFRFGFTGRELDPETGLYYYRARYYDPLVGRFISVDSIGFQAGDTNLYRYVFNSPTQGTDPSGHEWWDELGQNLSNTWNNVQAETTKVIDYAANRFWDQELAPALGDISDRVRGTIDNVVRYSPVGITASAVSATANIVGKIGNAIYKDWQDVGRNTDNIGDQILFTADKLIAGFADGVTLGATTRLRESIYGHKIKSQHQGAIFTTGQVVGIAAVTIVSAGAGSNTLGARILTNSVKTGVSVAPIAGVSSAGMSILHDIDKGTLFDGGALDRALEAGVEGTSGGFKFGAELGGAGVLGLPGKAWQTKLLVEGAAGSTNKAIDHFQKGEYFSGTGELLNALLAAKDAGKHAGEFAGDAQGAYQARRNRGAESVGAQPHGLPIGATTRIPGVELSPEAPVHPRELPREVISDPWLEPVGEINRSIEFPTTNDADIMLILWWVPPDLNPKTPDH